MTEHLLHVTTPHFCAGAVYRNGAFVDAAPILRWVVGKDPAQVGAYIKRKGWRYEWSALCGDGRERATEEL